MAKRSNQQAETSLVCSPLALAKAKIVAPLVGLRVIPKEQLETACRAAGALLGLSEGAVSHQTIRNWVKILETIGPEGLDRKPHANRGKSQLPPNLIKIIKGILLHPKRFSLSAAHRRITQYARHFLKLPEEEIPTRKQIQYIWEHIPEEEKILALDGITAYRRKYDACVRFEAAFPNKVWQADHHQLDIIVIDPETGEELGRPWITKIQDDHSRAIMGYFLSLDHPSSMSIASAFYHAFLPKPPEQSWWIMYGLPELIYIDNGKDWVSQHIEAVALKFGIQLYRHEPYHPQSKGKMERLFKTLEQMCIHELDGSVKSNLQTRPAKITPKLSLEQVKQKIERFIQDYHETTHGTTRQKPRERWEQNLRIHRTVDNLSDIDHLLKSKSYRVQRYGIDFQRKIYRDSEGILDKYINQKVTVFFDPRNTSHIRVWAYNTSTGVFEYICTATPQSTHYTSADNQIVAERNRNRRNAVRKGVRDVQAEGKKVLESLEVQDIVTASSAPAESPSQPVPQPKNSATSLHPQPHQQTMMESHEEDDEEELDWTEISRKLFLRQQRSGQQ